MRIGITAIFGTVLLTGCMSTQTMSNHGMNHGAMSHEDMMRHCEMARQHGGEHAAQHDPAEHGGMSHEEMMQHCQMMQDRHPAPEESDPSHH